MNGDSRGLRGTERAVRPLSRHDAAVDAALALALTAFGIVGTWGASAHIDPGERPVNLLGFGLVVLAALALAVRRRWPVVTLAVATVCTSVYLAVGYPYGPILLSLLIAVYTVARYLPIRRAAVAAAVALVFLVLHVVVAPGLGLGLFGIAPGSAWVVVPFAIGVTVGLKRESAVRTRAEWARQHADEERLRVAQEVHDVVGHGLSAIAMQADIALHLLPKQPEQAEAALAAISRTSREALDELRVTLAVVRRDAGPDNREPLPGLARLDALVARMSDSGVRVRVETTGDRPALPGAVDLAAYRVVQESLTNVLRHAGPASATVRLGFEPEEVTVEVTDTGRGGPAEIEPGHGLAGMRRRVTALGGTLTAGSVQAENPRGFRVAARIPLS